LYDTNYLTGKSLVVSARSQCSAECADHLTNTTVIFSEKDVRIYSF